jgi:hypothetical protein
MAKKVQRVLIRPLDIVRTPKGAIALVTETDGIRSSIIYFPNQAGTYEKNAWWHISEGLHVLGSLPVILANEIAHPFGANRNQGNDFFG